MVTAICVIDLDRAPRRIRAVLHALYLLSLLSFFVIHLLMLWIWATAFLFWFIAFKYDSSAVVTFFTTYGSSIYVLGVSVAVAGFQIWDLGPGLNKS
jgi:cellulose synthase/poly-beta-1,6-N-acetylglucosamine synthase-like glycosyltransferase